MSNELPSEMQMLSRYLKGLRSAMGKRNVKALRSPSKPESKPQVEEQLSEEEISQLLSEGNEGQSME